MGIAERTEELHAQVAALEVGEAVAELTSLELAIAEALMNEQGFRFSVLRTSSSPVQFTLTRLAPL